MKTKMNIKQKTSVAESHFQRQGLWGHEGPGPGHEVLTTSSRTRSKDMSSTLELKGFFYTSGKGKKDVSCFVRIHAGSR